MASSEKEEEKILRKPALSNIYLLKIITIELNAIQLLYMSPISRMSNSLEQEYDPCDRKGGIYSQNIECRMQGRFLDLLGIEGR